MDSNNKKSDKKAKRNKRIIKWMWGTFAFVVVALTILFTLIYNGVIGYMPPIEELKNPTDRYATVLFTSDGVEMGRYYQSMANRVYVDYEVVHSASGQFLILLRLFQLLLLLGQFVLLLLHCFRHQGQLSL